MRLLLEEVLHSDLGPVCRHGTGAVVGGIGAVLGWEEATNTSGAGGADEVVLERYGGAGKRGDDGVGAREGGGKGFHRGVVNGLDGDGGGEDGGRRG